jgi:hypothetical protein
VPLAPLLIVSHDALLDAVHAQPLPAVTDTLPVVAPAGGVTVTGEIAEAHCVVKRKGLETPLVPEPAGPTAATRAS